MSTIFYNFKYGNISSDPDEWMYNYDLVETGEYFVNILMYHLRVKSMMAVLPLKQWHESVALVFVIIIITIIILVFWQWYF